jgi:hypothetical protein
MPTESIQALQDTLNLIRQRKAARRLLASGPTNKAPDPSTAPTIAARIERLKAITAGAREDLARIAARQAPARPAAPPRPPAKVTGDMSRSERREVARIAATFSPATVGNFSDNYVTDLARHPSTSPADREVAKAQLTRRGITLYANGNTARSTRKA